MHSLLCGLSTGADREQERRHGIECSSFLNPAVRQKCAFRRGESLGDPKKVRPGQWWRTPFLPAIGRQGQAAQLEFEASLIYKVSSRTAVATQRDPGMCVCVCVCACVVLSRKCT